MPNITFLQQLSLILVKFERIFIDKHLITSDMGDANDKC